MERMSNVVSNLVESVEPRETKLKPLQKLPKSNKKRTNPKLYIENSSLGVASSDSPAVNSLFQSPDAIWQGCIEAIKDSLDEKIFSAWIKPLQLQSITKSTKLDNSDCLEVKITAPNKFCSEHIESRYKSLIIEILCEKLNSKQIDLTITVLDKPVLANGALKQTNQVRSSVAVQSNSSPNSLTLTSQTQVNTGLNKKYNFSNFVVGSCNQFAHAVSLQVSENLGTIYSPLFIYGGVGLGKTHLANAVGNASHRRNKKVLLVSSELFVTEFISSLRSGKMAQFRDKFRHLDVLIIDDIQFLMGKEGTQEEFFHTFNDLHQRRGQIIVTSDKLPHELVGLEERLRTRFSSGISVDLQAPDYETRVAILIRKAESINVQLPEEIARLVAEAINTNVRELEGALNRLVALCSVKNCAISHELACQVINSLNPKRGKKTTPEEIQKAVALRFNVSVNDLVGKRRTQNIAIARQVSMFLCRKLTTCSYPEIGALFGGRDHSTAIHAKNVIEEKYNNDLAFQAEVKGIESQFSG
jgi:chromosomal replication initiator protein